MYEVCTMIKHLQLPHLVSIESKICSRKVISESVVLKIMFRCQLVVCFFYLFSASLCLSLPNGWLHYWSQAKWNKWNLYSWSCQLLSSNHERDGVTSSTCTAGGEYRVCAPRHCINTCRKKVLHNQLQWVLSVSLSLILMLSGLTVTKAQ